MSSLTVTSLSRKIRSVLSLSPVSQCQMWLLFSSLSSLTMVASGSSALWGLTTASRGSYSTSTAATPSAAVYRSVASTAATSWPSNFTVSTGSTIWVSPINVGIHARLYCSRSLPVMTARTPSMASAFSELMLLIRAWATGLRTMSRWSIPGSFTSST